MSILKKFFLRIFGSKIKKFNDTDGRYQDRWLNIAKDFDAALNKLREKYENRN